MTQEERFWLKVVKGPGCWEWSGGLNTYGYGELKVSRQRYAVKAHRYAYELQVGPIPAGLCVCHKCDNPRCVRGSHLFTGTHADNLEDMTRKGRRQRGEKHGNAKLTGKQVRSIRKSVSNGVARAKLAVEYGVSVSLIDQIKSRKVWDHL